MRPHVFPGRGFFVCQGREELPLLAPLFALALPEEGSGVLFDFCLHFSMRTHPYRSSLLIQQSRGVVRHGGKQ